MAKKTKYYVVWEGRKPGIYNTWQECKDHVFGYEGAKYKSFENLSEATKAFGEKPERHIYAKARENQIIKSNIKPILESISTDAACSGNPGEMEYQGVYTKTKKRLFHYYHPYGTNNIGEFLGIVHGLSYLKRHNLNIPLYTDSVNAMKWVRDKKCKTKLERTELNQDLFNYIERAENWLRENTYTTQILKWDKTIWGEIPADFDRK